MGNGLTRVRTGGRSFTKVGLQYDPAAALATPVTAPTAALVASAGLVTDGTHAYVKTDVTASGESLPSPVSNVVTTVTADHGQVSLTTIAVGGTGVTSRKLYRSKAGTGTTGPFFLVTTIANNTATTFTDNVADGSLTTLAPTSSTAGGVAGTRVEPTECVPGKQNTLTPKSERLKEDYQSNTRFAGRINEHMYATQEGAHTYLANPAVGRLYLHAGLGGHASIASVSPVTTTSPVVTASGLSTVSASGAFTPKTGVTCSQGGITEPAIIADYATGTLTLYGLKKLKAATTGMTVTQGAFDKYANSILTGEALNELPLLTVQRVIGGSWAWEFLDVLVEKLDFTMANTCEIAAGLYGTGEADELNAGTTPAMATYDISAGDEANALKPFTAINSIFAVVDDPDGTGTAAVQAAIGIEDAKVSFDNGLIKKPIQGRDTYFAFPGDKCMAQIEYNQLDTQHSPMIWKKYVLLSGGAEFIFAHAKNVGTADAPDFRFQIIRIPFAKFEDSALTDAIGDGVKWGIKAAGIVERGNDQDLVQAFVSVEA